MSNLDFNPMPFRYHRGLIRWLLLAIHAILFALLVLAYPRLVEMDVHVLQSNLAHLLFPVWGIVLVVHLVIVSLVDVREGIIQARIERERRREYHKIQAMRRVRPRGRTAE